MQVNKALDNFLNSSLLSASIFITSGVYKTYKDYKSADDKYKSKFLIKDSVVLSGSALGLMGYNFASKRLSNIHIFKNTVHSITNFISRAKFSEKPVKYIKEITITEEELIKTTTQKIKRHEEMKKISNTQ